MTMVWSVLAFLRILYSDWTKSFFFLLQSDVVELVEWVCGHTTQNVTLDYKLFDVEHAPLPIILFLGSFYKNDHSPVRKWPFEMLVYENGCRDVLKTSLSSFCFKSSSSFEIFSRASWSSFFIFSQFFEFELDEFWLDDWLEESDWINETVGDWIDFSDKSQSEEDD